MQTSFMKAPVQLLAAGRPSKSAANDQNVRPGLVRLVVFRHRRPAAHLDLVQVLQSAVNRQKALRYSLGVWQLWATDGLSPENENRELAFIGT